MKFCCAHCGKRADKRAGEVNRARKAGLRLFCDLKCAGLARRNGKTKAQRKLEKKLYDQKYRLRDPEKMKAMKRAYHEATYDPAKQRRYNQKRMPDHVEYCRRPEYKRWKSGYDKQYRAEKFYGPFAEAAMLTIDLNREIKGRMTNHEIRWENHTANKSQFRARAGKEEKRSRPRYRDRRRDHSAADGQ